MLLPYTPSGQDQERRAISVAWLNQTIFLFLLYLKTVIGHAFASEKPLMANRARSVCWTTNAQTSFHNFRHLEYCTSKNLFKVQSIVIITLSIMSPNCDAKL
jgi:hypothetical protein